MTSVLIDVATLSGTDLMLGTDKEDSIVKSDCRILESVPELEPIAALTTRKYTYAPLATKTSPLDGLPAAVRVRQPGTNVMVSTIVDLQHKTSGLGTAGSKVSVVANNYSGNELLPGNCIAIGSIMLQI